MTCACGHDQAGHTLGRYSCDEPECDCMLYRSRKLETVSAEELAELRRQVADVAKAKGMS